MMTKKETVMEPDPDNPRALLMAASDDLPPGIDLLRGVRTRRAAAKRRRTRALLPAGAAVTAGAAAVAALLATSVSDAPSALAAVTSAMTKTSAQSYWFSLSSTTVPTAVLKYHGKALETTVSGAFDPRHRVGAEVFHTRGVVAQIRFIGGYMYTRVSPSQGVASTGKPWDKTPGPPLSAEHSWEDLEGYDADWPISPAILLTVLRSATTVRVVGPASGPGWTGTEYAFSTGLFHWANAQVAVEEAVSGTVYVDHQGRVRRLETTTSLANWPGQHGQQGLPIGAVTGTDVLTFGGFGTQVRVSPPPPGQVAYTAKSYWEFRL
jgi:hypothetical protein